MNHLEECSIHQTSSCRRIQQWLIQIKLIYTVIAASPLKHHCVAFTLNCTDSVGLSGV